MAEQHESLEALDEVYGAEARRRGRRRARVSLHLGVLAVGFAALFVAEIMVWQEEPLEFAALSAVLAIGAIASGHQALRITMGWPGVTRHRRAARWGLSLGYGMAALWALAICAGPALGSWESRESRAFSYCQNNLKQLGLVFKMYANNSEGQVYPQLSPEPGRLMFAHGPANGISPVYPEYLTDPCIMACPNDKDLPFSWDDEPAPGPDMAFDDHSYLYTGYLLTSDADILAFAQAYRQRLAEGGRFDEDLQTGDGRFVRRLYEGVERFRITDIGDPLASAKAQSEIPLLIERPSHHKEPGGNVLFLDGHVEFIGYPGKWPMTETTIGTLLELDSIAARGR